VKPALVVAVLLIAAQSTAPAELPASAAVNLVQSLTKAAPHRDHVWRDRPPMLNGLVNAYIEIPLGERRKYELDIAKNARVVDRVMPEKIGGYPVNYGIVPQTMSYDGDPFDVLVLGPALPGGEIVAGVIVGLMRMEDEKGADAKVVISRVGPDGTPLHQLTTADRDRMAAFFNRYKAEDDDPKTFANVPGWGSAGEGLSYVLTTHAFFLKCRNAGGSACRV
jgi:inorganic pyrophosphatase